MPSPGSGVAIAQANQEKSCCYCCCCCLIQTEAEWMSSHICSESWSLNVPPASLKAKDGLNSLLLIQNSGGKSINIIIVDTDGKTIS